MTIRSDGASGARPGDSRGSTADDPANIGLGATQPIDIPILLAGGDRQTRTSSLESTETESHA